MPKRKLLLSQFDLSNDTWLIVGSFIGVTLKLLMCEYSQISKLFTKRARIWMKFIEIKRCLSQVNKTWIEKRTPFIVDMSLFVDETMWITEMYFPKLVKLNLYYLTDNFNIPTNINKLSLFSTNGVKMTTPSSLKWLSLSNSTFPDISLSTLLNFLHVEHGNHRLNNISSLKSLVVLHWISFQNLRTITDLNEMYDLEELNMECCYLLNDISAIENNVNLRKVSFYKCASLEIILPLRNLKKLTSLDLRETKSTKDDIRMLKVSNRNLMICCDFGYF